MRKRYIFIFFLVLQLFITFGIGITMAYSFGYDKAPFGLKVGNLDLEGYSKDEAWQKVGEIIPTKVEYNGEVFDLDISKSKKETEVWLEKQYEFKGSLWLQKVFEYIGKYKQQKNLPDLLVSEEIAPQLKNLQNKINRPAYPARFVDSNNGLVIKQEETGYELDVEGSWQKLRQSYTNQPVPLVVRTINKKPYKEELSSVNQVLGNYTTYFDPNNFNRTNNLRLATNALNNTLVAPDEDFSFNRVVGERTETAGYKKAYIYSDKTVLLGDGGGICQDSSTLYQAVRLANLPIIERHSHTLPVDYVPKGEDATVSYGTLDFRFKNNTNNYLLIKAKVERNWLNVQIIGAADSTHPVEKNSEGYPVISEKVKK